jgi:hypothetical protein
MRRSGRERGRITAALVVSAGLVASASAWEICGNAVWSAPPRFDGAGYAVLARAWLSGQGYRAIDHPDRPRHAHFPPGYPLVLALTWRVAGESVTAAHVVSTLGSVGAVLAAWWWFRRLMPGPAALILGLALSVNWLWARTGSAIQSEPLYLLLGQLTVLIATATAAAGGRGAATGTRETIALGALLAACLLTRHVAIGLALAVLLELVIRRRWRAALAVAMIAALLVSPWLAWIAGLGPGGRTQADLLVPGKATWVERMIGQLVFYVQRIPDQLIGPFVEVGTVFQHAPLVTLAANAWAIVATAVIAGGWFHALRHPRRRLAGLVPLCTLGLLLVWPFTEAGRFLIPLIPCLLIGAVEGLVGLLGWLGRVVARVGVVGSRLRLSRRRLVAASLVFAASLPYSTYLLVSGRTRALEAAHRDFDAACDWLAVHADRPGPVLTRHPGEVFWRTGRPALEVPTAERPGDRDADAAAIARTIAAYRVAYLLIDQERYAHAPPSPLAQFVVQYPDRVRKVWSRQTEPAAVVLYEVQPVRSPVP